MKSSREVHDTMGRLRVPNDAYYGAQTARALVNFPLSGLRAHPEVVRALAAVKQAAARVNGALGLLPPDVAGAIADAAGEILAGRLHDQFVVDAYNAGAGTSMHMNANEVIAARATETLCGDRSRTDLIHPNDQVNLGQSTNDVIPTVLRLAGLQLTLELGAETVRLADAFRSKAGEFDRVVKSGRTHLQDALPVRLGQEFGGYELTLRRWAGRLFARADGLRELGLGGSAVGTGVLTHPDYRERVVRELGIIYGQNFRPSENLFESMQSQAPVVEIMSAVRGLALDLLRITDDLRLLSSGPKTGLAEIALPAVQPGSSMMPGKVNPVIAESTAMVCYQVFGCDAAVAAASHAGQLELNVMIPVLVWNVPFALTILRQAIGNLADRCVEGISADAKRCRALAEGSVAVATILTPIFGYERVDSLVKESLAAGKPIRQILEESGTLTSEQIAEVFDLGRWTAPGRLRPPGE